MYINTKLYESIVSKIPGTKDVNFDIPNIGIKKQRRIDTDERIFRSAVTEFADKGYGGAKVTDIAKTANISPGLIIQNYGGKEELFMAITECFVEDLYSALNTKLSSNNTSLYTEIASDNASLSAKSTSENTALHAEIASDNATLHAEIASDNAALSTKFASDSAGNSDSKSGDWRSLLCEIINITKARLFTSSNPENPAKQRLFTSSNLENSTKQRLFASSDNTQYSPFALANAANYTQEKQFADADAANLTRFFITALNTKSTPQKALDLVTSEFLKTPIPAAMKQGQSDGELVDGDIVDIYNLFFRTMSNILAFCSEHNMPLPPTDWFLQLLTKQ